MTDTTLKTAVIFVGNCQFNINPLVSGVLYETQNPTN